MSNVLPIPLAPFEEYLLVDDRPGYRMTFLVEQTSDGEIDRPAFEVGIAEACRRHPLLSAFVRKRRLLTWQWISAGDTQPPVDWASLNEAVTFLEDPGIDLAHDIGVRFFVRVGNGQSRLVTQFHHACCDGMGAIQYLSDLFAAYTRCLFPNAKKHPEYQPAQASHLLQRGDLQVHRDEAMSWFRLFRRTLSYVWKYSDHPAKPLARALPSPQAENPLTYPGTLTRTLSDSAQRALRQVARRRNATVNELLVCELMLAIRDWNQRHSSVKDTDQISILVPTNLRNLDHDQMPAANVMGLVAFQRPVADLNQPEKLLESVKKESPFYKKWRYAASTLDGLEVLRWFPGALRLILNRKKAISSAILSCIGDPSLAHASFTTWHFSNKLRLGVRCDDKVFTQESAQELLDLYADRVDQLAATAADRREAARVAA